MGISVQSDILGVDAKFMHFPFFILVRNRVMNIMRAEVDGDQSYTEMYNATYVKDIYGFSPQDLTMKSWSCQQKYGHFEYDPYLNRWVILSQVTPCQHGLPFFFLSFFCWSLFKLLWWYVFWFQFLDKIITLIKVSMNKIRFDYILHLRLIFVCWMWKFLTAQV